MPFDAVTPARPPDHCDVLVIGGGPAGSTMAALLAREGKDVVVVEKEVHPRFHIGESLLPANAALFDTLGVRDEVERIGMRKWGVEFVSPTHAHRSQVEFSEAWDKTMPYAWQVRRSELDELLFRRAGHDGARLREGHRARSVAFDADGATVAVDGPDGVRQSWRARFVVDASGRDTLVANQMRAKRKNRRHESAAIYGHYRGALRLDGRLEGNISVLWFDHGWCWFIPLADGTTSVGAVCWPDYLKSRRKPLDAFFADTIALCPELARRLQGAELVDGLVHATGNYSYSADHTSGDRYVLLGDAYAFIDPVFSSGVYLAMQSAFAAMPLVRAVLDRPRAVAAERRRFDARMRFGPRHFSWFIFRVTNPTLREMFMHPQNPLRVKEALMSVLAGDIYGATPIWGALRLLKGFYYAMSLVHARRTYAAWRQRRHTMRGARLGTS